MKPSRRKICLLFLLVILGKTNAQDLSSKLAEALQHTLDSMHQVLNIKGLGAAVQLPNNAIWAGGSGVSTTSPLDSISGGHVFEMGSSSKTITAACVLQLADEGVLSLDDSLHTWLDTFQHISPNITIRQLLRHQSGIYDVLQNPAFNVAMSQNINQIWSFENVITSFIKAPAFQPGTSWAYSNTNYILLGMIIEAATGHTYHQELTDRFFTPLSLGSYSNPAYDLLPSPLAHLWLDITGDGVLDDATNFLATRKSVFSAIAPAGGYYAKTSDLAQWIRTSMSGSLFSNEIWAEATSTVPSSLPGGTQYGLGLSKREYIGLTGLGHGGDLAGYSTQAYYFPEKDISIVVCGNDASINSWNLTNTISALLKTYIDCEENISLTIEPDSENISVSVFPNPFFEEINVTINSPENKAELIVQILDIMGQEIWHSELDYSAENELFNLSINETENWPNGIYILNISTDGKLLKSIKLMK
ncbi:MAG: serine hydrolase [Saprospiraceae bacterium]|nr:serine hydrolase [Saprospiraceae bacterium]